MADGPVQCVLFVLQLQKFVKAEGNVEVWLIALFSVCCLCYCYRSL